MALEDSTLADLSAQLREASQLLAVAIVPPDEGGFDSALMVAGLTIAERQRRQLQRLGATQIDDLSRGPPVLATARGSVLLIQADLVADERLIAAFIDAALMRGSTGRALIAQDWFGQTGGLAWLPQISAGQPLPDWSAIAASADRFDFTDIDDYAPERRRRVPLLWERVRNKAGARAAQSRILAAAQKGCLDWPARFIHPPVEDLAVRLLWPTPVTPNAISLLTFALGLYAAWCFASGSPWTGLLLALLVGALDGIDGKLARTRVEFSRWGDLEHVGDKIVEYAWFAALAAAIGTNWAWALAALIVFAALSEALQGEFYRRLTATQLDDAGSLERGWRLISGRRNTYFWTLLPFAWFGRWDAGYVMIAIYASITWFVAQRRFFVRLANYCRANSVVIAANLDATAYRFAPTEVAAAEADSGQANRAAA